MSRVRQGPPAEARRRVRRGAKCLGVLQVLAALALFAAPAWGQTTVFVVRHAERADQEAGGTMSATDPDLSQAGRTRAESLAAMLKDAGVRTIFVTQYKRTQQTAAPLAKAKGLTPIEVGSRELGQLAGMVRAADGNVLVVGHSNSVPNLLKALGVDTPIEIADDEYDNLFVVTLGEKPAMARLRYR